MRVVEQSEHRIPHAMVGAERVQEDDQRSTAAATAALSAADEPATTAVAAGDFGGNPLRPATVEAMSARSPAMLMASHGRSRPPRAATARAAPWITTSRAPSPRSGTAAGGSPPAGPSHERVTRPGATSSATP